MFTEVRAATLYKYYDHSMLRLTGVGLLVQCIRIYACLFYKCMRPFALVVATLLYQATSNIVLGDSTHI